jgi:hypothetical protein
VLRERIAGRERAASDASEAGGAVLEVQLATGEPLGEDELARAVRIETEGGDAATRAAIAEIAERLAG